MKNYCSKETNFVSEEYSGKIYKHQWQMDFLERKPQLKKVLNNPFIWQKFIRNEILNKSPTILALVQVHLSFICVFVR